MVSTRSLFLATSALVASALAIDTTSSYLPNVVNAITPSKCETLCTPFATAITSCIGNFTVAIDLATCSCKPAFLTGLSSCAQCEDNAIPGGAGYTSYSGFYMQCVSANLTTGVPTAFAATPGSSSGSSAAGAAGAAGAGGAAAAGTSRAATGASMSPVAGATGTGTSRAATSATSSRASTGTSVASSTPAASNAGERKVQFVVGLVAAGLVTLML